MIKKYILPGFFVALGAISFSVLADDQSSVDFGHARKGEFHCELQNLPHLCGSDPDQPGLPAIINHPIQVTIATRQINVVGFAANEPHVSQAGMLSFQGDLLDGQPLSRYCFHAVSPALVPRKDASITATLRGPYGRIECFANCKGTSISYGEGRPAG